MSYYRQFLIVWMILLVIAGVIFIFDIIIPAFGNEPVQPPIYATLYACKPDRCRIVALPFPGTLTQCNGQIAMIAQTYPLKGERVERWECLDGEPV